MLRGDRLDYGRDVGRGPWVWSVAHGIARCYRLGKGHEIGHGIESCDPLEMAPNPVRVFSVFLWLQAECSRRQDEIYELMIDYGFPLGTGTGHKPSWLPNNSAALAAAWKFEWMRERTVCPSCRLNVLEL